jgi:hypothetical protein
VKTNVGFRAPERLVIAARLSEQQMAANAQADEMLMTQVSPQ